MSNKKVTNLKAKDAPQPEEVRAKNNIAIKLNILSDWLDNGLPTKINDNNEYARDKDGEQIIDYFPASIQQFLKWNGTQNCSMLNKKIENKHGSIRGTGRATLERYDDLFEQAKQLIDTLKQLAKTQKLTLNKTSKIKSLKEDVILLEKAKKLSEIQHRQAVQIINSLRQELNDEIQTHESTKKLWTSDIDNRDAEISVLSNENRKLTSSLAKVTPIKKIHKNERV